MAMLAKSAAGHFRRFKGYDYTRGGSIFITATLAERRPLFGRVVHDRVELSDAGEILAAQIARVKGEFPWLEVRALVIMPDHLHLRLTFPPGLASPVADIGNFIGRIKQYSQYYIKAAGLCDPGLWLAGYHDHLCLSRNFIDSTERYIAYNVAKWELMHNMPGALQVHEPLDSPRLDLGEYWKGVGNLSLLDPHRKMLSLRISRQVAGAAAIAAVVARLEKAVAQGYVIISGFISAGEKAVRDMLYANEAASFIRILPSRIANDRAFRPESRYVSAFSAGRYLEIARGNEDVEFGRPACLDLNAEIVHIAYAGEGMALYVVNRPGTGVAFTRIARA